MPIFHDGEESSFGPTMGVAMAKHRAKGEKPEEKDEKKDKVSEHLHKAHEHVKAAMDAHDGAGDEHSDEGGSLMSLLGTSEDSES
jgi:hypothetical protein